MQIGLEYFQNLTTGLKLEQVPRSMPDHAEMLLWDIYHEAFSTMTSGRLTYLVSVAKNLIKVRIEFSASLCLWVRLF